MEQGLAAMVAIRSPTQEPQENSLEECFVDFFSYCEITHVMFSILAISGCVRACVDITTLSTTSSPLNLRHIKG